MIIIYTRTQKVGSLVKMGNVSDASEDSEMWYDSDDGTSGLSEIVSI